MKREKRAANPDQCGEICELEFSGVSNSYLTIVPSFNSTAIDISNVKNQLPPDIVVPNSGFEGFEYGFRYDDSSTKKEVQDFYKFNATKVIKGNVPGGSYYERYNIDKLVDVKITFSNQNYSQRWNIISFSETIYISPPLPEKDKEQSLPTEITKNDGEYQYQYTQFQDKLDYLIIQRRDFDKFNYSYYIEYQFLISLMIILNIWMKFQLS